MTRAEAIARQTDIQTEKTNIRRILNNAVQLVNSGMLTEEKYNTLLAREAELDAEFKAVGKFRPAI